MAWDFGIKWNKTFARRRGFTEKWGHVSQTSNMQLFLTWLSLGKQMRISYIYNKGLAINLNDFYKNASSINFDRICFRALEQFKNTSA